MGFEPTARNVNMSGAEYAEIFQKKQEDFNRYIQEMEIPINRLDLYLAAAEMVKNDKGDEELKQIENVKPRMNKHGREFLKSRLRTFLSPNTYMSEIGDKDVDRIYLVEMQTLMDDLYPRINEFACSRSDISSIYDMACSIVYLALKKARRDKGAIFGTMSSTNAPQQQQPQNQGWLSPQRWI